MEGMSYNGEKPLDVESLRERLRDMSNAELRAYGEACKELCSPAANFGKPPMEAFVVQLEEARAEWRCRHDVTKRQYGKRPMSSTGISAWMRPSDRH